MYPAINAGVLRAFKEGVVCSTSLMVPCPAAPAAMQLLRENPELPLGVHLTVISDLVPSPWAPLTPRAAVPSLLDEAGNFYALERLPEFLARARPDELEVEFRAQIEAALAAGLQPTHVDWHCLHSGGRADIFDLTLGLAREYGLALRVYEQPYAQRLQGQGLPTDDHALLDSYDLEVAGKARRYAQLLRELPAGLSEWAVHPSLRSAEAQAIDPDGWQVRHSDFEFLVSPEARAVIEQEGITLLSYRPLQAAWYPA
jgi:predicted glycoside hydrolase/deacetylase ChbG (UPF0249 family)